MWHVNDFAFEALNAKQYFTKLLAQSSKNIFSLIFGFYALVSFIFFNIFISGEPVDYVACFMIWPLSSNTCYIFVYYVTEAVIKKEWQFHPKIVATFSDIFYKLNIAIIMEKEL